jgi:hypothetical protein
MRFGFVEAFDLEFVVFHSDFEQNDRSVSDADYEIFFGVR